MKRAVSFLIIIFLMFALLSACSEAYAFSPSDVTCSDEFRFLDIDWDDDIKTVEKKLGCKLKDQIYEMENSAGQTVTKYSVKSYAVYSDIDLGLVIEFADGKVSSISLGSTDISDEESKKIFSDLLEYYQDEFGAPGDENNRDDLDTALWTLESQKNTRLSLQSARSIKTFYLTVFIPVYA